MKLLNAILLCITCKDTGYAGHVCVFFWEFGCFQCIHISSLWRYFFYYSSLHSTHCISASSFSISHSFSNFFTSSPLLLLLLLLFYFYYFVCSFLRAVFFLSSNLFFIFFAFLIRLFNFMFIAFQFVFICLLPGCFFRFVRSNDKCIFARCRSECDDG